MIVSVASAHNKGVIFFLQTNTISPTARLHISEHFGRLTVTRRLFCKKSNRDHNLKRYAKKCAKLRKKAKEKRWEVERMKKEVIDGAVAIFSRFRNRQKGLKYFCYVAHNCHYWNRLWTYVDWMVTTEINESFSISVLISNFDIQNGWCENTDKT